MFTGFYSRLQAMLKTLPRILINSQISYLATEQIESVIVNNETMYSKFRETQGDIEKELSILEIT